MEWLSKLFAKYPEMSVYLSVGIGCLIGKLKFRGVGMGAVTGSLLAGILIGNFFHVPVSEQAKAILFLLFLFGIGYSVGPSFFQTFKRDGWRWMLLGVFVPVIGLLAAYSVAHFLKLDVGYSAGLLSGSLTESPAIGTASEAMVRQVELDGHDGFNSGTLSIEPFGEEAAGAVCGQLFMRFQWCFLGREKREAPSAR